MPVAAARAKPASRAGSDQSPPGQDSASPSPSQKVARAHRQMPMPSLSGLSGMAAIGRRSSTPSRQTRNSAAAAPIIAGAMAPGAAAPVASTMKIASTPSTTVTRKVVPSASRSQGVRRGPDADAACWRPKAARSSRSGITPAERSIALRSQRMPNSRVRPPSATRSGCNGIRVMPLPSPARSSSRKPMASPAPPSAPRQPRVVPTASTTVSASMNSTRVPAKAV